MDLKGFNDNQKQAVLFKDGACCVIAGAGSGKTRVLTYRIGNLIEEGVRPENILAVTFTKKASEEMKSRLYDLIGIDAEQVNMGTFHSICFSILKNEITDFQNKDIAKDWWQKKTVKEIMLPSSNKYPKSIDLDFEPRQALAFISFQKNNLVRPDGTLMIEPNMAFMAKKLNKLYEQYEKAKESANVIDFDDMLIMCHELLSTNKRVLEKYKARYQYILVDEYQDTNIAQDEIIRLLGWDHHNVFVVGDDFQSIYGFRAGNVDIIINFSKQWDGIVIPLDINYRSTNNIVEWSNKLIAGNKNQYPKEIRAYKEDFQDPILFECLDEDDEASAVAEEIKIQMELYQPDAFVVLYRTNAQSRPFEEAMIREKIPYIVLGSANFYDRKEVKDIIAYLRLSLDLSLDGELERIMNKPNRFLGQAFIKKLIAYAHNNGLTLYEALTQSPDSRSWKYANGTNFLYNFLGHINRKDMKPVELIKYIRKETKYDEWLIEADEGGEEGENERIENLNSLLMTANKYSTVEELIEYIDSIDRSQNKDKNEIGKVKLMSIHRSKGLEFPVVFVAGVNKGLLPHNKSETEAKIEEERRLCYVAMTRAKDYLYMSWSKFYQDKVAGASDFIEELVGDVEEYVNGKPKM